METLKDIKVYIADMAQYCKIIESDATVPCKIAFTNIMRDVAIRIAAKCEKLEEELDEKLEREA